jgi:DNA-directed RNA polymerase specialized sigma24 family protein
MLVRRAVGFSDGEIAEAYGVTVEAIQEIVSRVERRLRSVPRNPKDSPDHIG